MDNIKNLSKIGKEISKEDIDFLDEVSGYSNLYLSVKSFLRKVFEVIKKYDMEEIKDRLLEFFDQIPKFNPFVMFSLSNKNSSAGIDYNRLNDHSYFLLFVSDVLSDIFYNCSSRYKTITIDEYFSIYRPSIYIDLNLCEVVGGRPTYNLIFLEKIVDDIVKRFKYLYGIEDVDYSYERRNRMYNPNIDVDSYTIKLYLK